jgi:AcrR family transcriptional regulator
MQPRAPLAAPRDRKGDRTRERLFQAALAEFRDTGFEAASVGAIAQRAGTSRASFYFYYPSKEAVLLDLQWRVEMAVVDETRAAVGLRAFLHALIEAICTADGGIASGGLLRVTLGVYIRQPAGLDLSEQPFPLMMEVARRFVEARDGALRPGLDPEQATELFLASLFGLVAGTPGSVATRRDALHTLTTLFLADETDVER